MPRDIIRPQQIITNAVAGSFSSQFALWGAHHVCLMVHGNGYTGSLLLRNSLKLGADLTQALSLTNPFDYCAMKKQEAAGTVIAGDTGAAFTTFTGVEIWEVNAEVFGEAIVEFTRSAGTLNAWLMALGRG